MSYKIDTNKMDVIYTEIERISRQNHIFWLAFDLGLLPQESPGALLATESEV